MPSTKNQNGPFAELLILLVRLFILLGDGVINFVKLILLSLKSFSILSISLLDRFSFTGKKLKNKIFTNSKSRLSVILSQVDNGIVNFISKLPKRTKKAPVVKKPGREILIFKEKSRIRGFKYFAVGIITSLIVLFFYQSYLFINSLPNPRLIGTINYPVSTQLYDRSGHLLYEIFRDESRTPVKLDELPEYIKTSTIATEDKDFYKHNGISIVGGVVRAMKDMVRTGNLQGGSTITQQLVKSALLTPERTLERKIREAILAVWTEQIYSKNEILEMYLNQVPYGGSSYGIEEAAETYFGKNATELSLPEAAFLAGLPQAPTTYSPYVNPQLSVKRRNEVLSLMLEDSYITEGEYEAAVTTTLDVRSPVAFIRAPHFVFYVKAFLEEKFGIRRVEEGGLRVTTSLDIDLQDKAEQMVNEELSTLTSFNVNNAAALVTKPNTGEILAMVGSKNYFELPYGAYNVVTARRQPGSAIKPVLYSLALQNGYTASTIIPDSPVIFQIPGSKPYRPVNYDGRFHGSVPLRYALANSYNVPAVKTLNTLGVKNFIEHAQKMGISTWDSPERYGLSLTLGGAEVKMEDMAVAFGVFANYGDKVPLSPVLKVEDFRGHVLYESKEVRKTKVMSSQIAFIISDILSDSAARRFAFGNYSKLDIPGHKVAVKTGTTNDLKDNWTIGYTRDYLTAIWVGNNDNTPMSRVASGVTGASPIWHRVMNYVLNHTETSSPMPINELKNSFTIPAGLVTKKCFFDRDEYYLAGTEDKSCRTSIFITPTPGVVNQ